MRHQYRHQLGGQGPRLRWPDSSPDTLDLSEVSGPTARNHAEGSVPSSGRSARWAGLDPLSPGRAARREAYERDGAQCCFVSESGVRCTARAFLQYDHIEATGIGGSDGASNGRVYCRSHNLNAAKKTFGREYVEEKIRLRQRRRSDTEDTGDTTDAEDTEAREKQDKLLLALTTQGFKKGEAKKATEKLAREARTLSREELLRRALALLVPR